LLYLGAGQEIAQSLLASPSEFSWKIYYMNRVYNNAFKFHEKLSSSAFFETSSSYLRKLYYCAGHLVGIVASYLVRTIDSQMFVNSIKQCVNYMSRNSSDRFSTLVLKILLCTLWRKLTITLPDDDNVYRISSCLKINVEEMAHLSQFTDIISQMNNPLMDIMYLAWSKLSLHSHDEERTRFVWLSWACAIKTIAIEDNNLFQRAYHVDFERNIILSKLDIR
jgi:hypothetical protein